MKRDDLISHLQVMHTWGEFHSERGIPLEPKCCVKEIKNGNIND